MLTIIGLKSPTSVTALMNVLSLKDKLFIEFDLVLDYIFLLHNLSPWYRISSFKFLLKKIIV